MKKHLRLILMSIMAMIVPLAVYAQQDVTATYLKNPGFEEGPSFFHDATVVINGWNISAENLGDAFLNQNDGVTPPQGLNVFGLWSPGSVGDFEISQTVKGLPAGTYTISCVLTTTKLEYTTQRLFVTSTSGGTKSLYYQSESLDTIDGEKAFYQGYPDDGNGNGPYREMKLKIKVLAGDSLAFGIRTNGTLSAIAPQLKAIGKNGNFKVDNFKMNFIADDVLYTKTQIQAQVDLVSAIRTDTIPGGYAQMVTDKIAWGNATIASQTNQDSLDLCLINITDFNAAMKLAKTTYLKLVSKIQEYEKLVAAWGGFSGRDLLDAQYEIAANVLFAPNALNADFNAAYTSLANAIDVYSIGRVPENLVLKATITTSYISSWENMAGLKDGYEPKDSRDKNGMAYGNWDGSNGKTNWVQFEWPNYMNLTNFNIYWWYDGGTPSGGGITQPLWSKLEYNQNGAWVLASSNDTAVNKWNKVPLAIKTNKIRITMAGTVATGILEAQIIGFGKANPDVADYKVLINDELVMVNAMNQDSLPKGYIPITTPLKAQSASLLLGNDSIALLNNYATLKAHRILLEAAMVSYKALNKTLFTTTAAAITASTHAVIKPRLQQLYDADLAILLASTSTKDTIDKYNTSLNNYLLLGPTLVATQTALNASTSDVIKPKLQTLYDNGLALFVSLASSNDTIVKTNTATKAYNTFNTTLIATKTLLTGTSLVDATVKTALQSLYDGKAAQFAAPSVYVGQVNYVTNINTYNTLLAGYNTYTNTLITAKVALDKYTDAVVKPGFQTLYDSFVATFTAAPTVVATINTANTALTARLTLNTALVNAKIGIDASNDAVVKAKLQTVYDNNVAIFIAPATTNTALAGTATTLVGTTSLNNFVALNTRLMSANVSLGKTTIVAKKASYQFAYDRAVVAFNPAKNDSVVFYTTSLYATQRLADTLATAETLMAQPYYVTWAALKGIYDASLATLLTNTNVAATLNTARTNLSAALLAYYQANPAPVGLSAAKRNDFVNVYPTSVKRGNMITIDFSKELVNPASVEMFMVSGQKVLKTNVIDKTSSVMVPSSLASGIYLMVFDSPEGKTFKKIVVE